MEYLWIVFIIIAYIVAWVIFVIQVIDEIRACSRCEYRKPSIIDFIEQIFSNDYVVWFLIAHAVVLFIISGWVYTTMEN